MMKPAAIIGVDFDMVRTSKKPGLGRVVRVDQATGDIEILAQFTFADRAKAVQYAKNYVAKFGHCRLRRPIMIGPYKQTSRV